ARQRLPSGHADPGAESHADPEDRRDRADPRAARPLDDRQIRRLHDESLHSDTDDRGLVEKLLSALAGGELAGFILVLARVTPLFVVAPLFSSASLPPRVRGIAAVAISIAFTPIALRGP